MIIIIISVFTGGRKKCVLRNTSLSWHRAVIIDAYRTSSEGDCSLERLKSMRCKVLEPLCYLGRTLQLTYFEGRFVGFLDHFCLPLFKGCRLQSHGYLCRFCGGCSLLYNSSHSADYFLVILILYFLWCSAVVVSFFFFCYVILLFFILFLFLSLLEVGLMKYPEDRPWMSS